MSPFSEKFTFSVVFESIFGGVLAPEISTIASKVDPEADLGAFVGHSF